ncbi:hypothetical protein CROQUDRAFT_86129 [Cronartium quercuum f. sp. fusiforme G11]|uniref:Deacetylase sirtuin-type domain-containing protein n=1 Tax=Cronartium quercuum f. sp. fusiforme G11 TaxID=708437 RepID=A0A9P6NTZ4_9BASI|nr:hypothetical protein CROQUDRAFT_86129 [Cronartium quercuum f. sp. fusiforme G11]
MSSHQTHLLLLPGTRKHGLGPIPSFVTPPPGEPDQELKRAIKAVLSAKKVAVVVGSILPLLPLLSSTGAGISTAANIPDFRSSTGLFASLKARFPNSKLTSGRDLFDINALKDPQTCSLHLGMLAELHTVCDKAEPTEFHKFLKGLDDEGKLSRVYTQNIDGLEEKVGLSYGVPDSTLPVTSRVRDSAGTQSGSSPKRGLKRKRGQVFPSNLPPTPPITPPGSVCETESSSQADLSGSEPCASSQLSSTSTVCPFSPLPKPEVVTRVRTRSASAAAVVAAIASAPTPVIRPVRAKPIDPFPRVIPLHGTLKDLTCSICKHTEPMADHLSDLSAGELIHCTQCETFDAARTISGFRPRGVGVLKSGVVLYGEEHCEGEAVGAVTSRDLMKGRRPDLLIVAGTSLKVPGTKRLVKELSKVIRPPTLESESEGEKEETDENKSIKPKPIHTIFLNNEFPSPCSIWKDTFDIWVKGNLDEFILMVKEESKLMELSKEKKLKEKLERERKKEEKLKATLLFEQLNDSNNQPLQSNVKKVTQKNNSKSNKIGNFFSVSKASGGTQTNISTNSITTTSKGGSNRKKSGTTKKRTGKNSTIQPTLVSVT